MVGIEGGPQEEKGDMAREEQENQAFQQILQLCQQGSPEALGQIAQIAQAQLQGNQQEEQKLQSEGSIKSAKPNFADKLMAAKAAQGGE